MASTDSCFYDNNAAGILGTEASQTEAQLHVIYVFLHTQINKVMLKSCEAVLFFFFFPKMSKAFWPLILTLKLVDRPFTRESQKVVVTIFNYFRKRVETWMRWLNSLRGKKQVFQKLALVENSVQL